MFSSGVTGPVSASSSPSPPLTVPLPDLPTTSPGLHQATLHSDSNTTSATQLPDPAWQPDFELQVTHLDSIIDYYKFSGLQFKVSLQLASNSFVSVYWAWGGRAWAIFCGSQVKFLNLQENFDCNEQLWLCSSHSLKKSNFQDIEQTLIKSHLRCQEILTGREVAVKFVNRRKQVQKSARKKTKTIFFLSKRLFFLKSKCFLRQSREDTKREYEVLRKLNHPGCFFALNKIVYRRHTIYQV